uniref:Reverse transcriptase domain-containing protein n=1 Tax=Solanum lycopersicum TaxID=4081 RepID=A0A3Q7FZ62_SOLLC
MRHCKTQMKKLRNLETQQGSSVIIDIVDRNVSDEINENLKRPVTIEEIKHSVSLCNVVDRITCKVLANRMKRCMNLIISEAQSAFIPRKYITDNAMIFFEAMHYLKRKTQGKEGYAALITDMSKAYDRVEWDFLRAMMIKMGFYLEWVNKVMQMEEAETIKLCLKIYQAASGQQYPARRTNNFGNSFGVYHCRLSVPAATLYHAKKELEEWRRANSGAKMTVVAATKILLRGKFYLLVVWLAHCWPRS